MSPASGRTLTCPHTWLQEEEILLSPLHKVTPSLGGGVVSHVCRAKQWLVPSSWCPAGFRVAEAVECQANSRLAGWQLMEPGGSRR